jgi:two-component system OmpR family response regulator
MSKPFCVRELMARVKAMLRRCQMKLDETVTENQSSLLRSGNMEMDLSRHAATLDKHSLDLTPKEFELLAFLIRNSGRVFKREQLLDRVWGYDYAGDTRTVDVHISWLRQKIEADPQHPQRLITLRGVGYKFE